MSEYECRPACERVVAGTLKWYSPDRGFGFIVDGRTGQDIRLTATELRDYGWETAADGSWIEAAVAETPRGLQVSRILAIVAPSTLDTRHVFGFEGMDWLAGDFVPARVIWYDANRGYGFASPYGDARACFLHWSVLAEVGLMRVAPGEAIAVRIGQGTRGRVAASIRRWDHEANDLGTVIAPPGPGSPGRR